MPIFVVTRRSDQVESDRATGVRHSLGSKVCRVGKLFAGEVTKMNLAPVYAYGRPPLAAVCAYTEHPGDGVRLWAAQVLRVGVMRNVTKVGDRVVAATTVDVIHLVSRPLAVEVEPRKSMHVVVAPTYSRDDVPGLAATACDGSDAHADREPFLPSENSGVLVVIKNVAQFLRGKMLGSHEALQLLIGQRPAGVRALGGLRYFSAVGA